MPKDCMIRPLIMTLFDTIAQSGSAISISDSGFQHVRLIRINNTNKASTQIWALLKTASIKVMAGGKHSFHMCATQNLHIWPPLFSSRLSFRAHVIEKPPASAKKAHSGKFFLKQPTSQLGAVFWLSARGGIFLQSSVFQAFSDVMVIIDKVSTFCRVQFANLGPHLAILLLTHPIEKCSSP